MVSIGNSGAFWWNTRRVCIAIHADEMIGQSTQEEQMERSSLRLPGILWE